MLCALQYIILVEYEANMCNVYCVSFQLALAFHDNPFVNVGNDLLVVYSSHIVYTQEDGTLFLSWLHYAG